jgi:TM2 domain-containing membrane protein YozV
LAGRVALEPRQFRGGSLAAVDTRTGDDEMDPTPTGAAVRVSSKNKNLLILLSVFLGAFGVDRFYRGQLGLGILKLITFGGCGIWALVDTLIYLLSDLPKDNEGRLMLDNKTLELMRSVKLVDQYGAPLN